MKSKLNQVKSFKELLPKSHIFSDSCTAFCSSEIGGKACVKTVYVIYSLELHIPLSMPSTVLMLKFV